MALFVVSLIVAVFWQWQRVDALSRRVRLLELDSDVTRPSPWTVPLRDERTPEPPRPAPVDLAPFTPEPVPPPEPMPAPEPEVALRPAAPPPAPPQPTTVPIETELAARRVGFEELFGRRLPIWAGGLTLATAGLMIVRYSIEAGLLSPAVRVVMALLFGGGLIGGAEAALRREVSDARVPQALAGAGMATLYSAILAAANLYGLVGAPTAFAGLVVVTVLAGVLSLRFGAPSAVLGLVGGLAAPALVGAVAPHVPLLAAYLALTVGGLTGLARGRGWWWLGALALVGGFGWGSLLLVKGALNLADTMALGGLTLVLAVALPIALTGEQARAVRGLTALAGCAQMAALVATGGFAPLTWGLFGLLATATVWLGRHEPALAELPVLALATGLILALAWPTPSAAGLAIVLAGAAAVHGLPALLRVWRADARLSDAGQIAAVALATSLLPVLHFPLADSAMLVMPALLGAGIAAGSAALGWRAEKRQEDARFTTLAVTSGLLVIVAAGLALPGWLAVPVVALVALALLSVGRAGGDTRVTWAAALFGTAAAVTAVIVPGELQRAVGLGDDLDPQALVRWGVPAVAAATFARFGERRMAPAYAAITTMLGYGAAAQVVPLPWLALVPPAGLAGLSLIRRREALPALATAAGLALGWALIPLGQWLAGAGAALACVPLLVTGLPGLDDTLLRLAMPAIALGIAGWRAPLERHWRALAWTGAALFATVALHILYKQIFEIRDLSGFEARGFAERTGWQILLASAAALAWTRNLRRLAIGLGAASLAHFAWFTLLLHDPYWMRQNVGPWLVPAFATAAALVIGSRWALPDGERARQVATIGLIVTFAYLGLRQITGGEIAPLWIGPNPGEDIARSVLAVALSVGFLRWGMAHGQRDWRIASLLLMLAATAKVFLLDAAGLDGLARIASFAALGFSLIGIGWLYSRYLPDAAD